MKVGAIDIQSLAHDRDQLFAEAVVAYRSGEKWWPDAEFERQHIKPEQEARYEADPWEEIVLGYAAGRSRVNVTEIAREALLIDKAKVGVAEQRRIAGVLVSHGWKSGRTGKTRFYETPAVTHDAQ
jgi:predicted P-loop ATPase